MTNTVDAATQRTMSDAIECADGLYLRETGDVVIVVWRDAATVERGRQLARFLRAAVKNHADGVLFVMVILASSTLPTPRRAAKRRRSCASWAIGFATRRAS